MQVLPHSMAVRFISVLIALWLGAGPARAGGGGADAGSLQNLLTDLCAALGEIPCPNLPTISQIVLEIAALKSTSPDDVRYEGTFPPETVVNAVNPPAGSPTISLSNVAPLAFVSGAPATVSDSGDPDANSFFYAATDGAPGQVSTTLNLVYDYPPLTTQTFAKGQVIAQFSLPLVILNSDGSETETPTTIRILGASGCGGAVPCFSATATGSFGTVDPAKLGLTVTFAFQSSANSATPHAVFGVQAKLIVTSTQDPSYFAADAIFPAAFRVSETGASSKVLPSTAVGIGIAPYAAPKCASGSACVTQGPLSNYPYCASIGGQSAVAAFLAIGKFGETYVSAPRQPQSLTTVKCAF